MAKSYSLRVGAINLTAGAGGEMENVDAETPFRILVLGNFSGAAPKQGRLPLAQRKVVLIDRDNFEDVMAKLGAQIDVPLGPNPQERISISFRDVEDFEPDRLFQRLSVFESLRHLRERLQNPAKFADAAAEIMNWAGTIETPAPAPPAPVAKENVLQQILDEIAERPPESAETDWNQFLKQIVQPHVVARTDPRLPEFETIIDEAVSAQMRALLHHPDFQAIEAGWRGLAFLVRRLETDSMLKLYMLDVTKEELATDVVGANDLGQTGIYQHLVERTVNTPGAPPWAVVTGAYTFGPGQKDVEMLANLAMVASKAGAPFLAAAHSSTLGCPSLVKHPDPREWHDDPAAQEFWELLRGLPAASYLGLAMPRFLLRLPYGKDFTTTEQFAFEEMPPGSPHEHYLWGNPAFAWTYLLGQSFSQSGWKMTPGSLQEIDGLPLHTFESEGSPRLKPCAELVLNNQAAERMLEKGIMPFLSLQGRDAIRLVRSQSVARPPAHLAGRWQ